MVSDSVSLHPYSAAKESADRTLDSLKDERQAQALEIEKTRWELRSAATGKEEKERLLEVGGGGPDYVRHFLVVCPLF